MSIRLTESRLRQIIREEASRLLETDDNRFHGRANAQAVGRANIRPGEIMDTFSDIYMEKGYCTMQDLLDALGPLPGFNIRGAVFSAGLSVDEDGNLYER